MKTPIIEITKTFYVRCAHKLVNLKKGHKCMNIHGEFYKIILTFKDYIKPQYLPSNMLIDFADIKEQCQPIFDKLDHAFLIYKNDNILPTIEKLNLKLVVLDYSPTAEYLAYWLYYQIKSVIPILYKVTVVESKDNDASYYEE